VSVRYQLKPLSKDQSRKYIDYSVGSSVGDVKLFDDCVKDLIHEFTGGNPRCINNAATACLAMEIQGGWRDTIRLSGMQRIANIGERHNMAYHVCSCAH